MEASAEPRLTRTGENAGYLRMTLVGADATNYRSLTDVAVDTVRTVGHDGPMFDKFTDTTRRVVVLAQEESRELRHRYIGTEHLLLGLLAEAGTAASNALVSLGISHAGVLDAVRAKIGLGPGVPQGHIPFTPRGKKVLELSLREAMSLGSRHIGPEHILLALVREGEGIAAQILLDSGVVLVDVRQAVLQAIASEAPGTGAGGSSPTPDHDAVAVRLARLEEKVDGIAAQLAALKARLLEGPEEPEDPPQQS